MVYTLYARPIYSSAASTAADTRNCGLLNGRNLTTSNVSSGAPQRWLWVTGPDYYLDEDGHDRRDLEPDVGFVPDGWWTCAPQTRAGDLVLLYRSKVRKDVSHLLVARSDAAPLGLRSPSTARQPVSTR